MIVKIIPPNPEYAELLHQWRNEPTTLQFNPVKVRTLDELQEILSRASTSLIPLDKTVSHRWFIECEDEVVGTVSLSEINEVMGTAEIGYMVAQSHHGRGIATQALKTWASMIFAQTDLRKLTASVAHENFASIRVLEKTGFKKEGILREQYLIQNRPTDQVVFGLLRSEWETFY